MFKEFYEAASLFWRGKKWNLPTSLPFWSWSAELIFGCRRCFVCFVTQDDNNWARDIHIFVWRNLWSRDAAWFFLCETSLIVAEERSGNEWQINEWINDKYIN